MEVPEGNKIDNLFGVLQGSVLGQLLFLLYVNDIINWFTDNDINLVLYADDTNIFITGDNRQNLIEKANNVLIKVNKFMKSNLLHINLGKCCFMHFNPTTKCNTTNEEDENLDDHSILNRIKDNIPSELHKNLYHTLFESHLAYGITAWGGVSDKKLQSLFKVQKRCLRILFSDKETYLNKFKTCCRVRPYDHQKLENSFYEKEHSKPIFNEKFIMTAHNLYVYHCSNETLKIMKYRTPISMFNVFETSNRKTTQMVTPIPDIQYVYNASITWNWARQVIKFNTDK